MTGFKTIHRFANFWGNKMGDGIYKQFVFDAPPLHHSLSTNVHLQ